ncbi:TlpA disulfide reductase family protein [Pedobacter nyackensis]|uniref:Peroxiredoxin n=1 Tax=Pedobacter nyackensis TaxID=475255 RepID=A0A1W2C6B2_9SPHI|nr:TlpA disulfide reductase family protein [Pedobacter nyackensis]SMC80797.1 Peroxiredoxin [Pedobacter nyackensis]
MKKIIKYISNSLLATTLLLTSSNLTLAQKYNGYTIKGTITDLQNGMVYLEKADGENVRRDSSKIVNYKFEFKGKADDLAFYSLYLSDKKKGTQFLLENKELTFTGQKDSLFKAKITGGPIYATYLSFYNVDWKPVTAKAGEIYKRMDVAEKDGTMKQNPSIRKGFDEEFKALGLMNDSIINAYVKRNSNSIASAMVILDRFINYPYYDNARALMPLLSKEVQQSAYGKQIYAALSLDEKTAIGKAAPVFSMADTLGKMVSLANFKGKYVLIDFWASWCGPCRKENPNVVAAYKKYHDKGFEILGVSLDSTKEPWLKAIAADGLTWNHVSDLKGWKNTAAATYGVKSVPASFLIGPDGKVIGKDLRGEALHAKLASLFTEK